MLRSSDSSNRVLSNGMGTLFTKWTTLIGISVGLIMAAGMQAHAATIQSLSLLSGDAGQRLSVGMDKPAEYQVFDLQNPNRLVLQFPGSSLKDGLVPLEGSGSIESIVPTQDKEGTRLEIAFSGDVKYKIEERGDSLLIAFREGSGSKNAAQGAELTDIQVRDRGAVTELVLKGNDLDVNHNALVTNDGQMMVLDFWNGASKLLKEHFSYSTQRVSAVTVGSAEGRLRLVVKLLPGAGNHQIEAGKGQMVVRFGEISRMASKSNVLVEAVDFQPDNKTAQLVIRTDTTNPVVNLQEKEGNIIIDLKNARLADGQERSLDVRAFSGPVRQIDTYGINKDVRIVARMRQKAEVTSFQSGNVLTVTLQPEELIAAKTGKEKVEQPTYTGQKVTFNFKDIDIRNALKLIAEMSDVNIIMTDDVTGLLTMRLVEVPWDQALELILASKGLGKEQSGNVMRIAPLNVLKADADARKQASESVEAVAPLETEFIQLGYASVNDVSAILRGESTSAEQSAKTASEQGATVSEVEASGVGSDGGLKLLSSRGSILMDERSNTMIITDTRERLDNIKRLIAVIDKPMKQILIEARIVEASDTFSRDLGVKWGGRAIKSLNNNYTHTVYGAAGADNVVDLGAAVLAGSGGAIGYTLGKLGGRLNLQLELSAAETEGKIKVVSSPRVFTSNLQEAVIEEDKQIPFSQTTFAGGVTTTSTILISAKLTLQVTPQVTADNRIIMKLIVNKDTPIANPIQGGDPTIDKKKVETKLLVKNGETVVLGGIYSQTLSENISGVPGLKDIPLVGNLFKRRQKTDDRNELLIFITPIIIGEENT